MKSCHDDQLHKDTSTSAEASRSFHHFLQWYPSRHTTHWTPIPTVWQTPTHLSCHWRSRLVFPPTKYPILWCKSAPMTSSRSGPLCQRCSIKIYFEYTVVFQIKFSLFISSNLLVLYFHFHFSVTKRSNTRNRFEIVIAFRSFNLLRFTWRDNLRLRCVLLRLTEITWRYTWWWKHKDAMMFITWNEHQLIYWVSYFRSFLFLYFANLRRHFLHGNHYILHSNILRNTSFRSCALWSRRTQSETGYGAQCNHGRVISEYWRRCRGAEAPSQQQLLRANTISFTSAAICSPTHSTKKWGTYTIER